MKTLFACSVILLAMSTSLVADPVTRTAIFDPTVGPNNYTIQFPLDLGGSIIEMNIVGGSFELVVDAEEGTAALASWHQEIAPIILFGMDTGPITITLVTEDGEDAVGTYNAETQEFSVEATFQIEFDDSQLWQVGFVSPVNLTAVEEGTIHGSGSIGSVIMHLAGEGEFAGGTFSYTCNTSARFDYDLPDFQAQSGDVNQDHFHDISDPMSILSELFLGGGMICPAAADVNGDESVDLSDAVYMLNYLFIGGPGLPEEAVDCTSGEAA
ncbi:MAG: hypothetical protein VYB34_13520 [Planctomycetota bacterium]|nr:hypothetical protein [Planctomycetota bacterium]|tara:strand:- start:34 stop:840 length:807 start_codon:yes stop_codon:yes gene_type:complete